jgi:hypothetical protein
LLLRGSVSPACWRAPGRVPSPWFDEPRQARRVLRAAAVLPGHVPSPWFDEPWRARLLPASPSLQLPPLAACAPPRLCRCSCLRSLPVCRRASAAAAASARCPCAAASPPLQLPPRRFLQSVLCALCVLCCAMCSYFLALCTVSSICALRAVFCYLRCPFWPLPNRVRSC